MSEQTQRLVVTGAAIGGMGLLGYLFIKYGIPRIFPDYGAREEVRMLTDETKATAAHLDSELEMVYNEVMPDPNEIQAELVSYKAKLDARNAEIVSEGGHPIVLPSEYDDMTDFEKAITLKSYYLVACQAKARRISPGFAGFLFSLWDRYGWLAWVGSSFILAGATGYALMRKIRPPTGEPATKTVIVKDHNGQPVEGARVVLDDIIYTTDATGTVSLPLKVALRYAYTIIKEGFRSIRTSFVLITPETNTHVLDPIANPATGDYLPDETPDDIVNTTPLDILALIASWLGTGVTVLREHPAETALLIAAVAVLAVTLVDMIPGDEILAAGGVSAAAAGLGISIPALTVLNTVPDDVVEYYAI